MTTTIQSILALCEECAKICDELVSCLADERTFLIQFKMTDLVQNNQKKENFLYELIEKKGLLAEWIKREGGKVSIENSLSTEEKTLWLTAQVRLETLWDKAF